MYVVPVLISICTLLIPSRCNPQKSELHIATLTDPALLLVADILLWMNMIDEGLPVVTVPDLTIANAPHKLCDGITTTGMATDGVVLHAHVWMITLLRDARTMTLTRHRRHLPLGIMTILTSQAGHTDAREARHEVIMEGTNDAHTGNMWLIFLRL